MHGGGVGLFSAIALNLLPRTGEADYIITGEIRIIVDNVSEMF